MAFINKENNKLILSYDELESTDIIENIINNMDKELYNDIDYVNRNDKTIIIYFKTEKTDVFYNVLNYINNKLIEKDKENG